MRMRRACLGSNAWERGRVEYLEFLKPRASPRKGAREHIYFDSGFVPDYLVLPCGQQGSQNDLSSSKLSHVTVTLTYPAYNAHSPRPPRAPYVEKLKIRFTPRWGLCFTRPSI